MVLNLSQRLNCAESEAARLLEAFRLEASNPGLTMFNDYCKNLLAASRLADVRSRPPTCYPNVGSEGIAVEAEHIRRVTKNGSS